MDEGIVITPGLQVTLAPRLSVRDDEIFVSREDAPALIQKISDLLMGNENLPVRDESPASTEISPQPKDEWDSTENT